MYFSSSGFNYTQQLYPTNQKQQNIYNNGQRPSFRAGTKLTQPDRDVVEISSKKKKKEGLSTGAKWAIGLGLATLVAGGIYFLSKGKVKSKVTTDPKTIDNFKAGILPQNITYQEFTSKDEAIKFIKNTLKIEKIDDDMCIEELNDIIKGIVDVSNKNKGHIFLPTSIGHKTCRETLIAQVLISKKETFGRLELNSLLYNEQKLDNLLDKRAKKYLMGRNGTFFNFKDDKLINVPILLDFSIKPDEKLSSLIQKYYKSRNSLSLKEKQMLFLSLGEINESIAQVEKAPLNILQRIKNERADFLIQKGLDFDIDEIAKLDLNAQSKKAKKLLSNLAFYDKHLPIECSIKNMIPTIYHEMGHLQDVGLNKALVMNSTTNINRYMVKKDFVEYLKKHPNAVMPEFLTSTKEQNTAGKVSSYATSSVGEFIAETYAKLISGEKLDDDVLELYKKYNGPSIFK